MTLKHFKNIFWFFHKEQTLFNGGGLYSAVKVTKKGDWIKLYTGGHFLQTSMNTNVKPHGSHFDWYMATPWFSGNFTGSINKLLILGLGGGAQAKLFNQHYKINNVTAVEIDPLIIELGKRYFNLNDSNMIIINDNALNFLIINKDTYDHIIVDIFKENIIEEEVVDESFINNLRSHLSTNGTLTINRLHDDPNNSLFGNELKKYFKHVYTLDIYYTKFFIATNCDKSPTNAQSIAEILLIAGGYSPATKFIKKLNLKYVSIL